MTVGVRARFHEAPHICTLTDSPIELSPEPERVRPTRGTLAESYKVRAAMDSFVQRQVRRSNRNLLLANLVVISAMLLAAYVSKDYLYNFVAGPTPLDPRLLENGSVPQIGARGNFFRLELPKALDTGFREVEQTVDKYSKQVKSEKVSAEYVAAQAGGRLLLLKVPPGKRSGTFEGDLQPLTSDIYDKFINPLAAEDERFRDAFAPVFLDSTGFRTPGYIGLAVAGALVAFVVWNLRKYVARTSDVRRHPTLLALARYGDPMMVASMIDNDFGVNLPERVKNLRLTDTWLASQRAFGCDIFYVPELVWVYKKVTRHYHNFIPTGKTYSLVINDARGWSMDALDGGSETAVDRLIEKLATGVPWAVFGYSDELKRIWSENTAGFVAAVQERRNAPALAE